jgi:hypothetical protein
LVCVSLDFLGFTTEVDCLPDEVARQSDIRIVRALFVGFSADKSCYAVCILQPEALIDLGINP